MKKEKKSLGDFGYDVSVGRSSVSFVFGLCRFSLKVDAEAVSQGTQSAAGGASTTRTSRRHGDGDEQEEGEKATKKELMAFNTIG